MYTETPEAFRAGTTLTAPDGRRLTVAAARPHKDHLLVLFEEIGDRTAAEPLRNMELWIEAADRPPLEQDEFWASDLIGREVRNSSGHRLGEVTNVLGSTVQDRLVVTTPNGVAEIPFVVDIVTEVFDDYLIVDPPEGLLP